MFNLPWTGEPFFIYFLTGLIDCIFFYIVLVKKQLS